MVAVRAPHKLMQVQSITILLAMPIQRSMCCSGLIETKVAELIDVGSSPLESGRSLHFKAMAK